MKSIMVVDDQDDIRMLIKMILTKKGYEVQTDATGDIVEKPSIEHSDLILLDINLGKNDGCDLCRRLKQEPSTREIPVILVSSMPGLSKIYAGCGANDYLRKPFSTAELISKVEYFLNAA
jgi:CheY-like chemotaxis protein